LVVRVFGTDVHIGLGAIFLLMIFALFGSSFLSDPFSIAVFSLLALLCLFAHEFAHVLAGRIFGISCPRISVWLFGMGAHLDSMGKNPKEMFVVSAVGPLTSFSLALFFVLALGSVPIPLMLAQIFAALVFLNVILGIFNILPLFPLDGGRVAHSIFWFFTKSKIKSAVYAVRLSKTLIVLLLAYLASGVIIAGVSPFSLLWPGFLAWLLWNMASAELQIARSGKPPYDS